VKIAALTAIRNTLFQTRCSKTRLFTHFSGRSLYSLRPNEFPTESEWLSQKERAQQTARNRDWPL